MLRDLRWERGLTQKQLAALAGVSDRTIRQWEQGLKDPRLPNFVACLEALGARLTVEPLSGPLASHIHVQVSRQRHEPGGGSTAATAPPRSVPIPGGTTNGREP
ncbi:helix-turn-helix transcriptional regulator [Nonomuraea turcica]|uniref:helix-turn-helix transcriptional regulator n=1 Tax=Nonomuraea sp. G32 TaxID=3067274 RepID=UPI0035302566